MVKVVKQPRPTVVVYIVEYIASYIARSQGFCCVFPFSP